MLNKFQIVMNIEPEELAMELQNVRASKGMIDLSCASNIYILIGSAPPFPSLDWVEGAFRLYSGWLDNLQKLELERKQDFYFMNGRELMSVTLDDDARTVRISLCDYDFEEFAVRDAEVSIADFRGEIIRCANQVKDAVLDVDLEIDTNLMRTMNKQLKQFDHG